ncbi:MAG: DUF2520 domain-containing protein [Planctomycetota bacterium]|jgi:predicted short-subunit dehydrogenase-like oxidoreductase (DUF2520 family)|nr:DUF2520 domain-containing protein [Planctomycetota bacterium]
MSAIPDPLKAKYSIVGPGRVGSTLAARLHQRGFALDVVVGRTLEGATKAVEFAGAGAPTTDLRAIVGTDIVLLTTPDGVLESIAHSLADLTPPLPPQTVVAHCSGALPASHLSALEEQNIQVGSLHPIQTFARPQEAIHQLEGTVWGVEGSSPVCATLSEIVTALGGIPIQIPPGPGKALYHAAAVVTSNYLITLIDLALALGQQAGISREQGLRALLPLARTTLSNLSSLPDAPSALTGPIARGDQDTIVRHLEAIETSIPDASTLYRALGLATLEIARQKADASSEDLRDIENLLSGPPD